MSLAEQRPPTSAAVHLLALGLTELEARAYTALLTLKQASPVCVSEELRLSLTRSREVLERLAARGLAIAVRRRPLLYVPLSRSEYVARSQRNFDHNLDALERELVSLVPDVGRTTLYALNSQESIVEMWSDVALERRCTVFGPAGGDLTESLTHAASPAGFRALEPEQAAESRWTFMVSADGRAAGAAFAPRDSPETVRGVCTQHPALVRLIQDYLCLAGVQCAVDGSERGASPAL